MPARRRGRGQRWVKPSRWRNPDSRPRRETVPREAWLPRGRPSGMPPGSPHRGFARGRCPIRDRVLERRRRGPRLHPGRYRHGEPARLGRAPGAQDVRGNAHARSRRPQPRSDHPGRRVRGMASAPCCIPCPATTGTVRRLVEHAHRSTVGMRDLMWWRHASDGPRPICYRSPVNVRRGRASYWRGPVATRWTRTRRRVRSPTAAGSPARASRPSRRRCTS